MSERPCHVLFLCTGNSARSILAEAALNHLAREGAPFRAYSAGSFPKRAPHPLALEFLREQGLSIEGLRSKSWDEFAADGAPSLDVVITVCDNAAGEVCPIWPGGPATAHWGVADPAAVEGSDAEKRAAFHDAYDALMRRIAPLARLRVDTLDRQTLQRTLREIGAS